MGCRYGVGGHHGLVGEFSARREVYIRIVLRILPLNSLGRCFFSTITRRNSRNPRAVFANEQFLRPVAYLQRELMVTVESIVSMVSMVVHMVLLDSTIPYLLSKIVLYIIYVIICTYNFLHYYT